MRIDPRNAARAACVVAALAVTAPVAAQDLGTLFHSAEERARLDKVRRGEPDIAPVQGKPRITGFVRRSDGQNTVWINGSPLSVAGPRAEQLLDPKAVRGDEAAVKIERAPEPVKR